MKSVFPSCAPWRWLFRNERPLAAVRDQYLFGPDLLVAPVITEDNCRTIMFPSGVWTNLWNGKTVSGPAELENPFTLGPDSRLFEAGCGRAGRARRELQFGASMSSHRSSALVVTPPNRNGIVTLVNVRGEVAKVTIQSQAGRSAWTLENLPETSYLLVYGTATATAVKVDGTVLPKLTAAEFNFAVPGWKPDTRGNRLVIRLSTQAPSRTPRTEIEVDFRASWGNVGWRK